MASVEPGFESRIQASKKLPVAPSPKNHGRRRGHAGAAGAGLPDLGRAAQIHRALGDDRPIRADDAAEVGRGQARIRGVHRNGDARIAGDDHLLDDRRPDLAQERHGRVRRLAARVGEQVEEREAAGRGAFGEVPRRRRLDGVLAVRLAPAEIQNVVRSADTASLPATSTPNAASAIPATVAVLSIWRVRPASVRFFRTGASPCRKKRDLHFHRRRAGVGHRDAGVEHRVVDALGEVAQVGRVRVRAVDDLGVRRDAVVIRIVAGVARVGRIEAVLQLDLVGIPSPSVSVGSPAAGTGSGM